jgi:hypothetical protein
MVSAFQILVEARDQVLEGSEIQVVAGSPRVPREPPSFVDYDAEDADFSIAQAAQQATSLR